MTDFLVIGGGIAGLSAGAQLSAFGKVLLLEAEDHLGYHTSGRSAALYEQSYGKPATVALNIASRGFLERQGGGFLSPRGLLLAGSAATAEQFSADLHDMNLTQISQAEALELCPLLDPAVIDRAGWHEATWDIDTDRLLQFFAKKIRQNGQIISGARVSAISRSAGKWHVQTKVGAYEGALLINAAGAWADQVAQMAGIEPLGLTPFRRSMARIPAPGGQNIANWPIVFGPGEAWYFKPDAGALIVSPAEEDPMEPHDAWADDMVIAEGLARYEAHVRYPVTRLLASWAGLRTFAPDRQLVLGPDPSEPSFIWSAGQGGYGFQTAPAAGQLVADLATGQQSQLPPEVVDALRPDRLRYW